MAEPSGDLHPDVLRLGCDLPGAAVLHGDAAGVEAGRVLFELGRELVVPAELRESFVLQAVSFPARTGTEAPTGRRRPRSCRLCRCDRWLLASQDRSGASSGRPCE